MKLTYTVNSKDISIKQILKEKYEMSENLIVKLKKEKRIVLNSNSVYINHKIISGDILSIDLDFLENSEGIVPNKAIKFNILYEDEAMLIVEKEAHLPVHPSMSHFEDSLSNGIKYYFETNNIKRKIRPVNRLDKDTSGIVIFAKNEYIQECLIKQMKYNIFKKHYIAILEGILDKKEGTIDAPINRKENSIIERCIDFEKGVKAITHYKVLDENKEKNLSKVEFVLETGRTHQIRVHSKYIGHPIVGDFLYGIKDDSLNRHLLHSNKIEFVHPLTKEKIIIESRVPEEFNIL